jgi:hypothetical protein
VDPEFDVDELLFTEKQLKQCAADVFRSDGSANKVCDKCACTGCRGKKARGSNAPLDSKPGVLVKCKWRHSHWRAMMEENLDVMSIATEYKHIVCGTPRQRHLLAITCAVSAARVQCGQQPIKVVNIAQSVGRCSATYKNHVPVITPQGRFFMMDHRRSLAAEELLLLMGLPLDTVDLGANTPAEVASMAGNAMHSRAVGAAIVAALTIVNRVKFEAAISSSKIVKNLSKLKKNV